MGIKKMTLFFLLLLAFFTSSAQQITEQSFPKEINGVEFTAMKLLHYTQNEKGITAFFSMSRTGAVRTKLGPIWNGAGDARQINAICSMSFDNDLKLVKTDLAFWEPKDATGRYEILANPVQIGKADVLATNEEVVTKRTVLDRFPELKSMNEKKRKEGPKLPEKFYDNKLNYDNLRAKVKAFDERIYRYQEPKSEEEMSFFGRLWASSDDDDEPEFNHKLESDKYNMESYRGASKEQWWVRMSGPFSDPISGNVIAHNYRYMRKKFAEADPRGYYEEVVTFDKDGKESQRIEIDFDKPYKFAESWHFQERMEEYDLWQTKGVLLMYKGKPSKKDKSVTKTARKIYFVNPDGTLGWQHDLELPSEKMRLFNAKMSGNQVILMGISWKPTMLHIYAIDQSGVHDHQTFDSESSEYKAVGATPIASNYEYNEKKVMKGTDGSHTFLYNLVKETGGSTLQDPNAKPVVIDDGYLLLKFDQSGKLLKSARINRSKNAALPKSIGMKVLEETDGSLQFLYLEPISTSTDDPKAYKVALKALQLNKSDLNLQGLDNKAPLLLSFDSYFVNEDEKAVYLFAEDLEKKELKLVKYPF